LFGIPISPAGDPGSVNEVQPSAWQKVLRAIHHEAVILSALAQVDHVLDRKELQAAAGYLALEAVHRDAVVSDRELNRLIDHVTALRPNGEAIERALDAISGCDFTTAERLLSAAIMVMDADGQRHALEVELINRVATELIGVAVI
jgi:tellurite resistance protein